MKKCSLWCMYLFNCVEASHFSLYFLLGQTLLEDLIMSGRYDTKDDFTVVYQPYLTKTRFPLLPVSIIN